jgi:galactokinase
LDSSIKVVFDLYQQKFGGQPLIIRSPARINLIGEHTDYNGGFVMPAAIDRKSVFAIGKSTTGRSTIYSEKYKESIDVDIYNPQPLQEPRWANYLLGVIRQLVDRGLPIDHFHCVFGGNIPLGAGLSSSASVECGFAFALNELFNLTMSKLDMIKIAQWSEHNFVGVKCGIMDQFASMMGAADQVLVLDCQTLAYHYSPLKLDDYAIVLCDTRVKHSLLDSEYNTRRKECEHAVAILKSHYPTITSLRDATESMLEKHKAEMPGKVFQRALYVVQEIARVQEASKDLNANDLTAFGTKMYDTHKGLSTLFEVSCAELDFLVDYAKKSNAVVGARMMGGGFGGCTINLVQRNWVDAFIVGISEAYHKKFNIVLDAYVVHIMDGTSLVSQGS